MDFSNAQTILKLWPTYFLPPYQKDWFLPTIRFQIFASEKISIDIINLFSYYISKINTLHNKTKGLSVRFDLISIVSSI